MKTTDLFVCLSLRGVIVEPTHDFNICVMSEDKNEGKKAVTIQRQPTAMFYIMNGLKINSKPFGVDFHIGRRQSPHQL
jgi:hypothetical protein